MLSQICRTSAAAEMLSPPPTVCTTCLHTITGAIQISMVISVAGSSAASRQHTTGLWPVKRTVCSEAVVLTSFEMKLLSRSRSLARLMSTVLEPHVCRYAVSEAFAMAAGVFGHSLLSASVTITYKTVLQSKSFFPVLKQKNCAKYA